MPQELRRDWESRPTIYLIGVLLSNDNAEKKHCNILGNKVEVQ